MIRLVVAPSGALRRYSGSDDARTAANVDGPLVDALAQRPQQPGDPLGVVAGDHRADVGQRLEDVEAAAGEVDGVDLDRVPAGLGGETGADGDAAQGDRLAGAAGAEHEQPAVGVGAEVGERLQLAGRLVADAEHDRQVVAAARAGGRARSWRRATAATAGAAPARPTARTRARWLATRRCRSLGWSGGHDDPPLLGDGGVVVEPEQAHPRHRRLHVGHRVPADVGALERHQLLRARCGRRPGRAGGARSPPRPASRRRRPTRRRPPSAGRRAGSCWPGSGR